MQSKNFGVTRAALFLLVILRLGKFSHKVFCLQNIGPDLCRNYLAFIILYFTSHLDLQYTHLFFKFVIVAVLIV